VCGSVDEETRPQEEGYEVQVSADASDSWTQYGNELALRRMENAGAVITTVDQIISELAIDWTSPNGQKLVATLITGRGVGEVSPTRLVGQLGCLCWLPTDAACVADVRRAW
jgi:hypothetical protein